MGKGQEKPAGELVQGTLDMLVLKTLTRGPMPSLAAVLDDV